MGDKLKIIYRGNIIPQYTNKQLSCTIITVIMKLISLTLVRERDKVASSTPAGRRSWIAIGSVTLN